MKCIEELGTVLDVNVTQSHQTPMVLESDTVSICLSVSLCNFLTPELYSLLQDVIHIFFSLHAALKSCLENY